jgi:hypothetical protein
VKAYQRHFALACKFDRPDLVNSIAQDAFINMSERGDAARGAIRRFLYDVARVAFGPFPFNAVRSRGLVQPGPPFRIRLATKATGHSLNHVTRIGHDAHATRLAQGFEAESGCGYLSLLISSRAEVSADRAPDAAIAEERDGCGAR